MQTIPSLPIPPAAFFDIDGTWHRRQLFFYWIRVAVEMGILPKVVLSYAEDALRNYEKRNVAWSVFVERQVNAYQGDGRLQGIRIQDAQEVARVAIERYGQKTHVFTRTLNIAAKRAGFKTVAISGSLTEIVEVFCRQNNIDYWLGTKHPSNDSRYTGGLPEEWASQKDQAVQLLAERHGLDIAGSLAIGDSDSDIKMLELVRYPLCMNPNSVLLAEARRRGWPVIFEKKDVMAFFRPDSRGRLAEIGLSEMLPIAIAGLIKEEIPQLLL
jgi:HAD superfamily phosphoserine phosphatase-like hydrolase